MIEIFFSSCRNLMLEKSGFDRVFKASVTYRILICNWRKINYDITTEQRVYYDRNGNHSWYNDVIIT